MFCDVLDGMVARKFHMETKFGLMLDFASDHANEAAFVFGALSSGIVESIGLFAIAGSVCLLAFRTLSYRMGLRSDYVIFGRTERLIFVLAGVVVPFAIASSFCFVAAGVFGMFSSLQIAARLWHFRQRYQVRF